jgi:ribose/xylose/arabinose/galactoside ABC-type transport system permease subunit
MRGHFGVAANLERLASTLVAVALFVIFAITADVFATSTNIRNILVQITIVAVVAAGQTIVMLAGGLDLSVGSVVLLSEVVVCDLAIRRGVPVPIAIVAALVAGALVGVLNGVLIVLVRIEPILVTLGTLLLAAGLAKLLLGLTYIQIDNPFFDHLATTELPGGIPLMVAIMFACYALVALVLYRTAFGKYVYAVGSNRRAAGVAGLPVNRTQMIAYVACSALAAVAGILNAARLGLVSPNDGAGLEFSSITAALVGGLSVTAGGVGRVERTLVGAVIIGMLVNYQTIRGVPPNLQQAMIGGVLLLAVVIDRLLRRSSR